MDEGETIVVMKAEEELAEMKRSIKETQERWMKEKNADTSPRNWDPSESKQSPTPRAHGDRLDQ